MCTHQPTCPEALAADRIAARVVISSLLGNGVVPFEDASALLPGKAGSGAPADGLRSPPRAARRGERQVRLPHRCPAQLPDVAVDGHGPLLHPAGHRDGHVPSPPAACHDSGPSRAATRRLTAQRLRITRLELDPVSAAPRRARAAVRAALAEWDLAALTSDAEAIASELVANAVAASQQAAPVNGMPAPVWLTITAATELYINVWDPSPDPPPTGHVPGIWDEEGRGLLIVSALSHLWGWYHPKRRGGKIIWAALITDREGE